MLRRISNANFNWRLLAIPLFLAMLVFGFKSYGHAEGVFSVTVSPSDNLPETGLSHVEIANSDPSAPIQILECTQRSGPVKCQGLFNGTTDADGNLSTDVSLEYILSAYNPSPSCDSIVKGSDHTYIARCYLYIVNTSTGVPVSQTPLAFAGHKNTTPVAALTVTPTSGVGPLDVSADASASHDDEGALPQYYFVWGDGTPDTNQATPVASHTYTTPGDYTVNMTVVDSDGYSDLAFQAVHVTEPPNVAPTAKLTVTPNTGNAPLSVTADTAGSSDSDGSIVSYFYEWGDGNFTGPGGATGTASHVYTDPGNYTVTVTMSDNDNDVGVATAAVTVTAPPVNVLPVAKLKITPALGVTPLIVTADTTGSADSDGSIVSYLYNWGDGTFTGPNTQTNPVHTYQNPGLFTVTLTVTDNNSATATATANVLVVLAPNKLPSAGTPVLSTTFGNTPLNVAVDASSAKDTDGTIVSYIYNWGDGTANTTQSSAAASHIYTRVGTFNFTLTVRDNRGGQATSTAIAVQTLNGATSPLKPANTPLTPLPSNISAFPETRGKNNLALKNYVVVMGDSYSSGEGAGYNQNPTGYIGGDNSYCHVHPDAYVRFPGWPYANIACSGALAKHVTTSRFDDDGRNQAPQIQQLQTVMNDVRAIPRVVVLTIGGNDLGFQPILKQCVLDFSVEPWSSKCSHQLNDVSKAVKNGDHAKRVKSVVDAIRAQTSPNTVIVVMGYPVLFSKNAKGFTCPVSPVDAVHVRQVARQVNASTESVVAAEKAKGYTVYLSTTDVFPTHYYCDGHNDNDWFVPVTENLTASGALKRQAGHPRKEGWAAEGGVLKDCIGSFESKITQNLNICINNHAVRTTTTADRTRAGGSNENAALEEDPEPELPKPGAPPAPTVAISGSNYVFSWASVPNAQLYSMGMFDSSGFVSLASTEGLSISMPLAGAPAIGTCMYLTAYSDDEGEVTGPCTRLPAPPPVPHSPVAVDGTEGMCKNMWQTRSLTKYASDLDGDIVSYTVTGTSFSRTGFNFTPFSNGSYTMKIPPTANTGGVLNINWHATDSRGANSGDAVLSIRITSNGCQ